MKPLCCNEHELMSYTEDGEPWFRANDVASIFGYACPRDAIRYYVPQITRTHFLKI